MNSFWMQSSSFRFFWDLCPTFFFQPGSLCDNPPVNTPERLIFAYKSARMPLEEGEVLTVTARSRRKNCWLRPRSQLRSTFDHWVRTFYTGNSNESYLSSCDYGKFYLIWWLMWSPLTPSVQVLLLHCLSKTRSIAVSESFENDIYQVK